MSFHGSHPRPREEAGEDSNQRHDSVGLSDELDHTPVVIGNGSSWKDRRIFKGLKKYSSVFGALALLVGLGASVYLAQQPQDIRQQAREDEGLNQFVTMNFVESDQMMNREEESKLQSYLLNDRGSTDHYEVYQFEILSNKSTTMGSLNNEPVSELSITIDGNKFQNIEKPLTFKVMSSSGIDEQFGKNVFYQNSGNGLLVPHEFGIFGFVDIDGINHKLWPLSENLYALIRLDMRKYPETTDLIYPSDILSDIVPIDYRSIDAGILDSKKTLDDSTVAPVSILVGYTTNAKNRVGGNSNMIALINTAISYLNLSFHNSNVLVNASLVGVSELQYDEVDTFLDLARFKSIDDGFMDEIHLIRDQVGADLVALIYDYHNHNPRYCGVGYLNAGYYGSEWGFSTTAYDCISGHTFSHEIGHNFGAHHNPEVVDNQFYEYGHGRFVVSVPFRTIMSYRHESCPPIINCPRIPYWSSPTVHYQGVSTGTPESHDNVSVLNQNRFIISNFRHGGTSQLCENDVPLDGTACQFNGDAYQYRCTNPSAAPDPSQWSQEPCSVGNTCQGTACTDNQISCSQLQPRFRLVQNGNDLGWVSSGTYSPVSSISVFETAVFVDGDTENQYMGEVKLTQSNGTVTTINGQQQSVPQSWQTGSYILQPYVNGSGCDQVQLSLGNPPTPTPTPEPPPVPHNFNLQSEAEAVTLNWVNAADTTYRLERCTGAGCSNFSQIASPSNSPYTDSINAGNVYRYRLRAVKNGVFSNYTSALTSSVSWTIHAQPVCPGGTVSSDPRWLITAPWPPSPLEWTHHSSGSGVRTVHLTSTHSWNNYYIYMRGPAVLKPVGTPPHQGIAYSESFNPYTWMAVLDRDVLPAGTYTLQFEACAPSYSAFVTSVNTNGNLGGLSGADAICQQRAVTAGLSGMYTAWLSTNTVNAKDRIPDASYYLVGGGLIASNKAELTSGSISSPINRTEFGSLAGPNVGARTGTNFQGNINTPNCNNWTSGSSSVSGRGGFVNDSNSYWTQGGTSACNLNRRLYCFENQPKRVFVTNSSYNGDLGGLSGADVKCQTHANNAGLAGTYRAWLSTSSVDAKNRVTDATYALVDGTVIANNINELTNGSLNHRINMTALGQRYVTTQNVWTGTQASGLRIANQHCNNWNSVSGYSGRTGRTNQLNQNWTESSIFGCGNARKLYCFEI